jgi:hypothetical protein
MTMDMGKQLRDAIRKSELPLLTIAKKTGVNRTTVWEFMEGADMRLSNASKIASYLEMELVTRTEKKTRKP